MRNNKKIRMKSKLLTVILLGIVIIVATLGYVYFTHNKTKKQVIAEKLGKNELTENSNTENANSENKAQALDEEDITANWDLNKVDIYTDPYGNKAPIPKGFTVSGVASERYIETEGEKPTRTETQLKAREAVDLTFTSTGDYPWTQNEDGVWQSGNYHIPSSESTLESNEFTLGELGGEINVTYSVSSQSSVDRLTIIFIDVRTGSTIRQVFVDGTGYGTVYENLKYYTYMFSASSVGPYKLLIRYFKNDSRDAGLDRGFIKNGTVEEYYTEEVEVPINGGLVIYEGDVNAVSSNEWTAEEAWNASINNNQFVWVPVENASSRIYEKNATTGKIKARLWYTTTTGRTAESNDTNRDLRREPGILNYKLGGSYGEYDGLRFFNKNTYSKGLQGYTKDALYKELETEYKNTIKSIEKYGGFYIGRYETGDISSETPVVRRMNTDIHTQSWYNMYTRMKNISNNPNIQTSMIWGSLFDETLEWIIETGDKARVEVSTDSTSWGNYYNSVFQYYNSNGELTKLKKLNDGGRIPTGSTERNSANNIYDLCGNVWDWTLEGDGSANRFLRGGYYSSNGTGDLAQSRCSGNPNNGNGYNGFRAYFYIK